MMKTMNKVIAAIMIMAITSVMPTMAGNRKHTNNVKKSTVVVVTNTHTYSRYDKVNNRTTHYDAHKKHSNRPVVKTCTFKVNRHAVAKAERMNGVMDAHWNPRTHEITVRYDARITSARQIMHFVA